MIRPEPTAAPAAQPPPFALRRRPINGLGALLVGDEEKKLVLDVLDRQELFRYYGNNAEHPPPMAATLERKMEEMVGVRYALGVTSGTAALETALAALGIGPGDEVIIPAYSWISCFTSVVRVGARPVLAEIDDTLCLNPREISRLKTPRTKAVMVIHYQGVAADMDQVLEEARKAGLAVVEDCAESAGAVYRGRRIGSMGNIGIFSFQHQKTLTSGEGGVVVTNDERLYERAVRMHDVGMYRVFHHKRKAPTEKSFPGAQYRMSELHAAVALAQLSRLEGIRAHCRQLYKRLFDKIQDLPGLQFRRIPDPDGATLFELYLLLESPEMADDFRRELNALNVNCRQTTGTYCHYRRDYCLNGLAHAEKATPFAGSRTWPAEGYRSRDFPATERLVHRFVALPLGVLYTGEDADYIARCVTHVHEKLGVGQTTGSRSVDS